MTQAPLDFGDEASRYDAPGWMYLAIDEEGSPILKVGFTTDINRRSKEHRKKRLTIVGYWPATKLDEADFHEEHRRYRTKLYGRETYWPVRPVIDWVLGAIDTADESATMRYPRSWSYLRVANEVEMRHTTWLNQTP